MNNFFVLPYDQYVYIAVGLGMVLSLLLSESLGVVAGGNLDYWFADLPLAIRYFGNGYMIRQPNDSYTGFGNIGAALIVVLKRGG